MRKAFDQLSRIPQVSFQISQTEHPVIDILTFLSQLENPVVIAIDEFQQIHSYPEKTPTLGFTRRSNSLKNVFSSFQAVANPYLANFSLILPDRFTEVKVQFNSKKLIPWNTKSSS